jgi:carboxypeptidase C (cathepsin A)
LKKDLEIIIYIKSIRLLVMRKAISASSVVLLAMLGLTDNIASAARIQDLVLGLPDVDRLNADWYSGYLDATDTKKLHYVFVTSLTDPINDPVVLWFNGGPGCSSMLALFQEHGPYVIDDGEYYIKTNPEPWNKRANILYLESPAGVGFSTAGLPSDYQHNDMSQSKDAMAALLSWYKGYPEYLRNDLYISGESYGGIYTPYLAWQVHQHNQLVKVKKAQTKLNLKGFIVGNGATNWEVDVSRSFPEVMYNFNLIQRELLNNYTSHDCKNYFNDLKPPTNSSICNDTWN